MHAACAALRKKSSRLVDLPVFCHLQLRLHCHVTLAQYHVAHGTLVGHVVPHVLLPPLHVVLVIRLVQVSFYTAQQTVVRYDLFHVGDKIFDIFWEVAAVLGYSV